MLCKECLASYVLATPGLPGCPLVPSGDCDDGELPQAAVLHALGSDQVFRHAYERYLNAIRLDAVEDFRREELARLARVEEEWRVAQEDALEQARLCVVEALTLGQSVPCPECKNPKRKDDACMHMSCECGARFCYVCGQLRAVECGCDSDSVYLQNNAGWGNFAQQERGEAEAHGALVEFHRLRMARFVRVAREQLITPEVWSQLEAAQSSLLTEVLEGRSIAWADVQQAEHPQMGRGAARGAVQSQEEAFVQRWRLHGPGAPYFPPEARPTHSSLQPSEGTLGEMNAAAAERPQQGRQRARRRVSGCRQS